MNTNLESVLNETVMPWIVSQTHLYHGRIEENYWNRTADFCGQRFETGNSRMCCRSNNNSTANMCI